MKKHNIKINILMAIAILAVMFTACNKDDEYEQPNSFSDVGWYIAYPQSPWPDTLLTNKNDYLTFSDLSQNTISHKWEIESGNFFLAHPIERLDSIFDDKIIGSGSTTDKTISVWFKNSGYNHVRLFNIFPEKVTFRAPDSDDNIEAQQVGDAWVIDKTFVVDVYDTIVPTIRVEQKGVVINHESETDTVYVEAGDAIDLFDETAIGRPDTWSWNLGGSSSNQQNVSLVLKKLGVWFGTLNLSRTGQNIPGDWETYRIPVPFKVIPSSQPFVAGTPYEREDQTIVVPFNGEFAPFINHEQYFTVTVNGGAVPVTINNINIDPNDATLLLIQLNETIYSDDVITVSYDGNGTFQSTDTRDPVAFTDLPVTPYELNLIPAIQASFENTGDGWEAKGDPTSLEFVTGGGGDPDVPHGDYMAKIVTTGGGQGVAILELTGEGFVPGVEYKFSYKVYAVPGSAGSIRADWEVGGWHRFNMWQSLNPGAAHWQGGPAPGAIGAWAQIDNKLFTVDNADVHGLFLRANGAGTYYFDDLKLVVRDERP
ncbi:hypothetical protein [Seonamhaeicola sp.]|uniref:hypothetical protein n=1 Tax=Seonamhaeicola sp. TaxID=1912245 RepID=UPI00261E9499|nr:hypothetical protein [Seonamhaeicola sp.]